MRILVTVIIMSLIFFAEILIAEPVPHLINYQGKLTGADGNALATADYSLSFEIFNQASDGTAVWGPQVFDGQAGQGHGAKVPVVQGYFNVILGPEDTTGRSIVDAFASADAYLQISVDGDAPILPRQRVLSAPYAVKAEHAAKANTALHANTADTVEGSHLYVNPDNGNIGIGTSTPTSSLDIKGGIKFLPSTSTTSEDYEFAYYEGENTKTITLGEYSFCALGYVLHDGTNGGYCRVSYDAASKNWMLTYHKWVKGGIGCAANCF